MKTAQTAVEGRVQPTGSAPEERTDAVAGAVESLGNMAGVDDPQPDRQADEAAAGDETEATDEQAPEGEATEEAAEESDEDAAEGEEPEGKQDHRSPRAEKRIAELTAEKKQAESKAQAAETRVQELESVNATQIGLHPDYVTEPEAKLIARARELQTRERELLKFWDGIDSDDPARSKTADQVRTEWADVRAELDEIGPRARRLYDERLQQQIADQREGRRARLEREKAKRGAPAPVAKKATRPAPPTTAPRGAAATPSAVKPRGAPGPSKDRFIKAGASREAAIAELGMMAGPD